MPFMSSGFGPEAAAATARRGTISKGTQRSSQGSSMLDTTAGCACYKYKGFFVLLHM